MTYVYIIIGSLIVLILLFAFFGDKYVIEGDEDPHEDVGGSHG